MRAENAHAYVEAFQPPQPSRAANTRMTMCAHPSGGTTKTRGVPSRTNTPQDIDFLSAREEFSTDHIV
jgi:hypothetical protein